MAHAFDPSTQKPEAGRTSQASLVGRVSSRIARTVTHRETLSQKQKQKSQKPTLKRNTNVITNTRYWYIQYPCLKFMQTPLGGRRKQHVDLARDYRALWQNSTQQGQVTITATISRL